MTEGLESSVHCRNNVFHTEIDAANHNFANMQLSSLFQKISQHRHLSFFL